MTLAIDTFSNPNLRQGWRPGNNFGGSTLFKALGHPKAAAAGHALVARLRGLGRIAVYDPEPEPAAAHMDAFFDLASCDLAGVYVQRVEDVGAMRLGLTAQPVTALAAALGHPTGIDAVLVTAFDAQAHERQLRALLGGDLPILTLDALRLPEGWLSNGRRYLDPLNFATNFALIRDEGGRFTRITSANYWAMYGAEDAALWCAAFDGDGHVLAEWEEALPPAGVAFTLDSREIRARFGLPPFTGSLFLHALRVKGHDVVKYALDVMNADGSQLSCTHDANAWPADLYAGVPAPGEGERLLLLVQNSHPVAIPAGAIGARLMGSEAISWHAAGVPPFGTAELDLGAMLPGARFPQQIEIHAGRYFVRPRYETITGNARVRIAHANVERTDLDADPALPGLAPVMGKGFILPLPVLPQPDFASSLLPTPMATCQADLPVTAALHGPDGGVLDERFLGRIARADSVVLDCGDWLAACGGPGAGWGHVEFRYDFRDGGSADGWLHALGRYTQQASGHAAETIFGAHIYNTVAVYRDEPQSYTHRPPGLTTRLFLRVGAAPLRTLCHLIYPASTPWHALSQTELSLIDGRGEAIAHRAVAIPCNGSLFWYVDEQFTAQELAAAGPAAWVRVRDGTCRLFGFHGLQNADSSFCLDHMFGF